MTDFEHADISRRLALAIGWPSESIIDYPGQKYVGIKTVVLRPCIRLFDFEFPAVIWPIAERFNCFPRKSLMFDEFGEKWFARARGHTPRILDVSVADTAALAVALAVIKAKEKPCSN